jgi:hypothetical protein
VVALEIFNTTESPGLNLGVFARPEERKMKTMQNNVAAMERARLGIRLIAEHARIVHSMETSSQARTATK